MKHLIYLATNLVNNKKYVGQTRSNRLDKRISEHIFDIPYTKQTTIFHAALDKYGIDNFKFEIIEDNISEELIDQKEKDYIIKYNTYYKNNQGYNMTFGGQGTHGYIFTEADKLKMSKKSQAYWKNLKENNQEEYARICKIKSQINKGKPKSEEHRRHLSEARKGKEPWNKGLKGAQKSHFKGTSKWPKILMMDSNYNVILEFSNYNLAGEYVHNNIKPETLITTISSRIFKICREYKGQAYGFIWRFNDYKEKI